MGRDERKLWQTRQEIDRFAGTHQPGNWNVAAAFQSTDPDQAKAHIASATIGDAVVVGGLYASLVSFTRVYDFDLSNRQIDKASRKRFKEAMRKFDPQGAARGATFATLGFLDLLVASESDPDSASPVAALRDLIAEQMGGLNPPEDRHFGRHLLGRALLSLIESSDSPHDPIDGTPYIENDLTACLLGYGLKLACGTEVIDSFPCVEDFESFDFELLISGEVRNGAWRTTSDLLVNRQVGAVLNDLASSAEIASGILAE